ncbi:MAG: AAA domain-containing protein [Candidatus Lokiarchaeota archaeon]|nr:AAA domain-containing protein [Candidatus Lokiarchaeota archaeon]
MNVDDIKEVTQNILTEVRKVVVGKGEVLQNILIALLCNGHILLEGVPGVAKTFMAKSFATALGCSFKRIQFTPDMLPADVTGTNIFDETTNEFKFKKGPIFANIILADEINRAPPKTQAALLECMEEKQVTIENETYKLPPPFMVLATQNPVEQEGTYPLPEAQLDRFLFKLIVGYPTEKEEVEIMITKHKPQGRELQAVTNNDELVAMQEKVKKIHIDNDLLKYIRDITVRTRKDPQILLGGSPRASLVLMNGSKARAAILGRDYVIPDDIVALVQHSLYHRLILKPEAELGGTNVSSVIKKLKNENIVPI